MKTYVLQYTYGEILDKQYFQGITCPECGQNKLVFGGRTATLGWKFKCMLCNRNFYIRLAAVDSQAPTNKTSRIEV